jgi:fumarate reductase subunit D
MSKGSKEPLLWLLFSAGGVVSATLMPVHLFLFALAFPLGWLDPPGDETLLALIRQPLVRVYLFVFCFLSLFHSAHRFRFTLYDGLQIKHEVISVLCYGGAAVGTVTAAYLLWQVP